MLLSMGIERISLQLIALAIALGSWSASALARPQSVATWSTSTTGNWKTASLWSSAPFIPNNDAPAGTTYHAVVDAAGTYEVSVNVATPSITVDRLTINSPGAMVYQTGSSLRLLDRLDVQSGTFRIWAGEFYAPNLFSSPSGNIEIVNQGHLHFLGGTLAANITVPTGGFSFEGGATFDNATFTLGFGATSAVSGGDLLGNGTIVLGNGSELKTISPTCLLGSGMTLRGGSGTWGSATTALTNNGTLLAEDGNTFRVVTTTFHNNGVLKVTGGEMRIGGTITPADLGTTMVTGGRLTIGGTLNNAGSQFDVTASGGAIGLSGGTISGGSIVGGPGASFDAVGGGTLDGVTLNVSAATFGNVKVRNGLTLNGTTISFQNSGGLGFQGSQTLAGIGTLVLDSAGISPESGTLTIGPQIVLHQKTAGGSIGSDSLVTINQGTILHEAIGSSVYKGNDFINQGTIAVRSGIAYARNVHNFGTMSVDSAVPIPQLNFEGAWQNQGTIIVNGGILNFGGTFTTAGVGTIVRSNGSIAIAGTLNNSNAVFVHPAGVGTILLSTGSRVIGGEIAAGSVGLAIATARSTTFEGVKLATDFRLDIATGLAIDNFLDLGGHELRHEMNDQASITLNASTIRGPGAVRVNGVAAGGLDMFINGVSTVGANAAILGENDRLIHFKNGGTLVNNGTLRGYLAIDDITLTNNGTFEAVKIGALNESFNGTITNLAGGVLSGGTWNVAANSTMTFKTASITTNAANIGLLGTTARFPNISSLQTNSQRLRLADGATFATTGNLTNTGTVTIDPANSALIVVGDLTNNGTIDLNDRLMIDHAPGPSRYPMVAWQIAQARNGGDWSGVGGITSSIARGESPHLRGIGAVTGADYRAAFGPAAKFAGRPIDDSSVLLRFTLNGDTDLNGAIDFDDYARIDSGFNNRGTDWFHGDFNYDGVVNFDDYALIDLAFNTQNGTLRQAQGFLSGDNSIERGMDEPGPQLVRQHLGQFGTSYARHFLATIPEPGFSMTAAVACIAIALPQRRKQRRNHVR